MNKKQFRVNDLVKFNYSEIGEYVDENHTDRPLRNDEVVNKLNEQQDKITELEIELTDCKNRKEQSEYNLRRENELLKKDNQRQKTLRNKHWREIQARANAYNRIISSLEEIIPQPMIEELRNAPLLGCDYDGVESNE